MASPRATIGYLFFVSGGPCVYAMDWKEAMYLNRDMCAFAVNESTLYVAKADLLRDNGERRILAFVSAIR